jgi:hypothetical protein
MIKMSETPYAPYVSTTSAISCPLRSESSIVRGTLSDYTRNRIVCIGNSWWYERYSAVSGGSNNTVYGMQNG